MAQLLRTLLACVLVPGLALAAAGAPARKVRVAVMELRPLGTEAVKAELLSEVALTEASRVAGLEVIGKSDIAGIVGFEKQKAMLGCGDDTSCIGELAGALGVDYLVLGSLGRLGALHRVDLKLVDARKVRVLGRAGESVSGEEERLVATVQRSMRELLAPISPAAKAASAAATPAAVPPAASAFDGRWRARLDCPPTHDARGYTADLDGFVTGGALLLARGEPGAPGSMRLEGPVGADGTAALTMSGVSGATEYTVGRLQRGSPVRYPVEAKLEADRGTGKRTLHRPCSLVFTRL